MKKTLIPKEIYEWNIIPPHPLPLTSPLARVASFLQTKKILSNYELSQITMNAPTTTTVLSKELTRTVHSTKTYTHYYTKSIAGTKFSTKISTTIKTDVIPATSVTTKTAVITVTTTTGTTTTSGTTTTAISTTTGEFHRHLKVFTSYSTRADAYCRSRMSLTARTLRRVMF